MPDPTPPSSEYQLHLPENFSYTCHNSGVCCTTFDNIPVDEKCGSQLTAANLQHIAATCGDLPQTSAFIAATPDGDTVARSPHGGCVFYGKDKLCAIHKVLGEQAKPQVCRDFPYRYIETPDGIYVGLSFVCPSVRGNLGAPLSEQTQQIASHYTGAKSVLEAPSTVLLNRRIELSWVEYTDVERSLLELLTLPLSLRQRLLAACALVTFIDTYHERVLGATVVGETRRMPEGKLGEFLAALRATGYAELLRVVSRPRPSAPRVKRMFLGMFTSFANTLHRKGGRARTVTGVMLQYMRHAAGLGGVVLKPIEARISHKRLLGAVVPDEGPAAEMIARYAQHCVFRKDLVFGANVSRRLRLLVLNVALIPWYAAAEAQLNGRETPAPADFSEAIAHVEKFYGFHSRFYRFFEENVLFEDIVESFLLKPNYPHLMLSA